MNSDTPARPRPSRKPKMILSSRTMPQRMFLRRSPASYGASGPASSTGTTFPFHLVADSPPCSPGLPALLPRHGKKMPRRSYRARVRLLLWLFLLSVVVYFISYKIDIYRMPNSTRFFQSPKRRYRVAAASGGEVPDRAAALLLVDQNGKRKWTVSIPPALGFPLAPREYKSICSKSEDLANEVAGGSSTRTGYYDVDKNFLDIAEAEAYGPLVPVYGSAEFDRWSPVDMLRDENSASQEPSLDAIERPNMDDVCEKSLTFVLETTDAGMGTSLLQLWTTYGLAQKEKRAFFIDDTNWPYGRYSSYFESPPQPSCQPPPRHHVLPCPHHARHLLISAATSNWAFGEAFHAAYQNTRSSHMNRGKPIFDLVHAGYKSLFKLNPDDAAYVSLRKESLTLHTTDKATGLKKGTITGIHVRRGDRRPLEYQYAGSYIPLDRYAVSAREAPVPSYNTTSNPKFAPSAENSLYLLASDDPDVYTDPELSFTIRAQEQIVMASKKALEAAGHKAPNDWVDSVSGWEGGFYKDTFWSLGGMDTKASVEQRGKEMPEMVMKLRELVGRAYLLDIAVLGESSETIVCGVSAVGCRLLAVIMGWQKAIKGGAWINVDGTAKEWRDLL